MLALIISAHNEEMVLRDTVTSAIEQGQDPKDIYIVADASADETMAIAIELVGIMNCISATKRSKARALKFGVEVFDIIRRYKWIHIADADGTFGEDYFKILRGELSDKYAAATGYIRSRPGSYVSAFRVLEYTWGMEVTRRTQSWLRSISVIPGPSSIFRADVFARLDWEAPSVAEDFDVTLQIHRKKLGPIQFIPIVKANTQDPYTFDDYVKQISRWSMGTFQSMYRHRIGTKAQMIDLYLVVQVLQSLAFVSLFFIVLPAAALITRKPEIVAFAFVYDIVLTLALSLGTALRAKRIDVLTNFPLVYGMKWVQALITFKYFTYIYLLGRCLDEVNWSHKVARYKQSS